MRHHGVGRLWLPLLAVAVVLTVWFRTTGTEAAFAVTSGNPGNTFTANPDWKPPIISRATVLKSEGGIPGYVRASGSYTVLAGVVDDPSSNPPAGIASVLGNVSTVTAGATALTLTSGAQTVAGLAYTHATTTQTVPAGRAAGSYGGSITAKDLATPVNSSAAFPFTIVVDNTAPSPSGVTTANGGGLTGQVGNGDTITYTWNEPIDPWSIVSGWDGAAPQPVTLRLVNKSKGQGGDQVTVWDTGNTTQLPLGTVQLGDTGFIGTTGSFGGPTNSTRSTMAWNATTGAITVTVGPADAGVTPGRVTTPTSAKWLPDSGAFDRAGNASSTTTWTESGTSVKF